MPEPPPGVKTPKRKKGKRVDDPDYRSAIERHHNLPKDFKKQFERAGLNIEDFVEEMPRWRHRLKPNGVHTGPNNWNKLWREFFNEVLNPSREQILDALDRFRALHGLSPWAR